jgi:opacity protein-like surface antigen
MNWVRQLATAFALAAVVGISRSAAQNVRLGVGGGLTAPQSDYKSVDKTGWHALVRADVAIPLSPVAVRVDGLYSQTSHQDINGSPVDGNTKIIGGLASLVWKIPTAAPMVKPYVLAGGGMSNFKQTFPSSPGTSQVSETKFTWAAGLGLSVGVGPVHGFVEGRYMSVQTSGTPSRFVPVTVGLTFGSK